MKPQLRTECPRHAAAGIRSGKAAPAVEQERLLRDAPRYSLDDATLDNAERVYRDGAADHGLYHEQLVRWQRSHPDAAGLAEFAAGVAELDPAYSRVLALAAQRRGDTIEALHAKSDLQVGMHPIPQAGGEMVRSAAFLHRELVVPGVADNLTHAQRREVLVDIQLTVETVQKVVAALMGSGGGRSEVDVHLDSAVRGLVMSDAGMCEALDALGPVPGGKPVPSAVQARRVRRGLGEFGTSAEQGPPPP